MEVKKRVLFLDDRSDRFKRAIEHYKDYDLTIVCTVQECIEKISEGGWYIVSLDHDLNYERFVDSNREDCGMEVVRFFCKNILYLVPPTKITIHSSNHLVNVKMANKILDAMDSNSIYKRPLVNVEQLPYLEEQS